MPYDHSSASPGGRKSSPLRSSKLFAICKNYPRLKSTFFSYSPELLRTTHAFSTWILRRFLPVPKCRQACDSIICSDAQKSREISREFKTLYLDQPNFGPIELIRNCQLLHKKVDGYGGENYSQFSGLKGLNQNCTRHSLSPHSTTTGSNTFMLQFQIQIISSGEKMDGDSDESFNLILPSSTRD